jgi:branched-chain amino acid transport system ATP-binding protein
MNILEMHEVHTHIMGFHILEGVNLTVPQEKLTVLLGRNGAGKTTTMKTIMGLIPSSSGKILFKGQPIQKMRDFEIPRLGISLVPESRDVFSRLTVEENLRLAVRNGKNVRTERLEYILDIFPPMKDLFKKKGGNLSGGETQMVAIARALVNEDVLLIIDEPTKGLAPIIIESLGDALAEIKKNSTILLVEQNFEFAISFGDDYLIMEQGKVVHSGKVEKIKRDKQIQSKYLGV